MSRHPAWSPRPITPGVPVTRALREALSAAGVGYCQWKGHWKRQRWATGQGDIDLLVARADMSRFMQVLHELGFKEALISAERQVPGVTSFYAYDPAAVCFIHVHAHDHVLIGDPLTLNYRLPIEEPMLASSVEGPLFPIPAPEFELLVWTLKRLLACSWTGLLTGANRRSLERDRAEFEYLTTRADPARLQQLLDKHLPLLEYRSVETWLQLVAPGQPEVSRLAARRRLIRRLKSHARRSPMMDAVWRLGCRVIGRIRRRWLRRSCHTRLVAGGAIVALLGGDGAGKSTAVAALHAWLHGTFGTARCHLGKPPRSWLTLLVGGTRRAYRALRGLSASDPPGLLCLLRAVCTARDRFHLYINARRWAARGAIVLCDRYPSPYIRSMDGPAIGRSLAMSARSRVGHVLQNIEASYYRRILLPDVLILLRVNPEIAARRKTDEDAAYVRARSTEIWELDARDWPAHVIDAGRPRDEVLSDLRSVVWTEL